MRIEDLFYFVLRLQMLILIYKAVCWVKQISELVHKHQRKPYLLLVIPWKKSKFWLFFFSSLKHTSAIQVLYRRFWHSRQLPLGDEMVWQLQETIYSISKGTWTLESKTYSCVLVFRTVSCTIITKLSIF